MKSDQTKKFYNSPTKDFSKNINYSQYHEEDSDFDFNEKSKKILNETEHINGIKNSINVRKILNYYKENI